MVFSFCGAMEPPSPVISVVMPCESLLRERLSIKREASDWPSMSMKPGATMRPLASISRLAWASRKSPIAASRAPLTATSAAYQGLPSHLLRGLRIRSERDVINVGGEGESLSIFGDDVAGEAFAVKHHLAAQLVIGAEGAGFCKDMAGAGGGSLNFRERAVFAENRERLEKNLIVRAGGPVSEVLDHEVWAEKISPIAAGAIALRGAGEIELGIGQECVFDNEAGMKGILGVLGDQEPKEIRAHSCMEILADLQSDFDFFGEWRGNVFGDLVFRRVKALEMREVQDGRS